MKSISISLPTNWKTTLGGVMAGVPALVTASGFEHTPHLDHWLNLCSAVGMLLMGMSAKDWNTHSTESEVKTSTAQSTPTPAPTA